MIITTTDLLNSGLPVSEEISDEKLERAIKTAEQFLVKPRLGALYVTIITEPSEYATILDGGIYTLPDGSEVYLSGLCEADKELAYACLLRDILAATTFGSVLKKDDYSDQSDEERLNAVARYHTEIGLAYLKEVTDVLGIDNTGLWLNNWFEELI